MVSHKNLIRRRGLSQAISRFFLMLRTACSTKCPFGTTPHVVEPKCPGVVERYIDLSQFYDRAGLQPLKGDILAATAEYQGYYKRAYRDRKSVV